MQLGCTSQQVVDTVLAKLFAQFEKTTDLYGLLQGPNDVVVSEVETAFQEAGQYSALCMLYKQHGDDEKLLETWSKCVSSCSCLDSSDAHCSRIADGQWTDDDIPDPLSNMLALLSEKRHRSLVNHWGVWLTKRDPDRALKVRNCVPSSDATIPKILLFSYLRPKTPASGEEKWRMMLICFDR